MKKKKDLVAKKQKKTEQTATASTPRAELTEKLISVSDEVEPEDYWKKALLPKIYIKKKEISRWKECMMEVVFSLM